jgi:hypothetical protein
MASTSYGPSVPYANRAGGRTITAGIPVLMGSTPESLSTMSEADGGSAFHEKERLVQLVLEMQPPPVIPLLVPRALH